MEDVYYKFCMFQKNGKKKILIDYSWINQKLSGGGLKSCQNLHKIFTTNHFQKHFDCTFLIKKSQKKLFNTKNFSIVFAPHNVFLNHFFRIFISFFYKKIECFDIIFIPNIYSPIFTRNVKVCNLVHDGQWLIYPEYFSLLRRAWFFINYYIINGKRNYVIFTSNYVKKQYSKLITNSKKKVISLPFYKFEKKIKKVKILKNKKFNLILSSNLPHKNIEVIIRVHKKREKLFKNLFLVIAGIGQQYNYDKSNKIINLGEVSENEKYWLLNKCSNFIIPSLYEGFGMIMIESIMYSKKIISSYKTALIETGNNSINYVNNPESEMEWKSKIFYSKKKDVKKFNVVLYTHKIIKSYVNLFLKI